MNNMTRKGILPHRIINNKQNKLQVHPNTKTTDTYSQILLEKGLSVDFIAHKKAPGPEYVCPQTTSEIRRQQHLNVSNTVKEAVNPTLICQNTQT